MPDPSETRDPKATTELTPVPILLILAFDHRRSVERDLYSMTAPNPQIAARIAADKLLVYQALLDAAPQLPRGVQAGILIDEEYGASVAELASKTEGAISLAMPIEASGQDWLEFAYGTDWRRHADFFATDHAKVLVRDNPGFTAHRREAQARRLAEISEWAKESGRSLLIELLVPPTTAEESRAERLSDNYDDDKRPADAIAVIEYLQAHGVEPTVWKLEGLNRHDDAVALASTVCRGGRDARCIVLGRHATEQNIDRWIRVAAPVPGWTGFAIGRTIWWDPLHAHLHRRATTNETRHRIRDAYLDFAQYYVEAHEGGLTTPDRVEVWG
jgi:myo-inositol catabolism protein IolC